MKAKAYIVACSTSEWDDDDCEDVRVDGELRIETDNGLHIPSVTFLKFTVNDDQTFSMSVSECQALMSVLSEIVPA